MGPQIQKISSGEAVFHAHFQIKIPLQKIPFSHTFSRGKFSNCSKCQTNPRNGFFRVSWYCQTYFEPLTPLNGCVIPFSDFKKCMHSTAAEKCTPVPSLTSAPPKWPKSKNRILRLYPNWLVLYHGSWPPGGIWGCLGVFGGLNTCFTVQNHYFSSPKVPWGPYEATMRPKLPKIAKSENRQIARVLWLLGHASCLLTLTRYLGVFEGVWGYNCVF